MTRSKHMQWSKDRALEYIEQGDIAGAFDSLVSDLSKHKETANHLAPQLGMMLQREGHLSTSKQMKEFIEGIN